MDKMVKQVNTFLKSGMFKKKKIVFMQLYIQPGLNYLNIIT